jgi:hypothetical protein
LGSSVPVVALPPELIRVLLARRIDLRNALLERFAEAINDEWDDADDPRWYRAVHYGFLLIAYRERRGAADLCCCLQRRRIVTTRCLSGSRKRLPISGRLPCPSFRQ